MKVERGRLELRMGKLHFIQVPKAQALGLLEPSELSAPHSVLLSEGARFRVYITRDPAR